MNQAYPYMDIRPHELITRIENSYSTLIFELAMFSLLKKQRFSLIPHPKTAPNNGSSNHPDFMFEHNSVTHHFECTTRSSSLMNQFFSLQPRFKTYISVAKIFNAKHDELTRLYNTSWGNTFWTTSINMISVYLTNEEKNQITSLLQAHDYREAEENFLSWVYHVRYACTLYKDLIHQNILNELESIHFADGVDGDGTDDYRSIQYATNCIAQALIDKAKKGYFNAGQPVTLAISFALSRNIFAIRNEDALISFIKENLEKCDYQGKLAG